MNNKNKILYAKDLLTKKKFRESLLVYEDLFISGFDFNVVETINFSRCANSIGDVERALAILLDKYNEFNKNKLLINEIFSFYISHYMYDELVLFIKNNKILVSRDELPLLDKALGSQYLKILAVIEVLNKNFDKINSDNLLDDILLSNSIRYLYSSYKETISNERIITDMSCQKNGLIHNKIISSIINKTPLSLIRLGDGEGYFLKKDFQSKRQQQDRIAKIWFGESISDDEKEFFSEIILQAIQFSDIIGVPKLNRIVEDIKYNPDNENALSIQSIYEVTSDLDNVYITDSFIHFSFRDNGVWDSILSEIKFVNVISGHVENDVKNKLDELYGLTVLDYIKIPSEFKYRSAFGHCDEQKHYPDVFNKVCDRLVNSKLSGEVYLVSAGFLGKHYCNLIKKSGGIAIDVGSLIDYFLGYQTRRHKL